MSPILVYGTSVAVDGRAVLLRGASGTGKSDLALRLIDGNARLIADDQSELCRLDDRILVSAPAALAGLIEVRGLGIMPVDAVAQAPLALVVDLVPPALVERLPDARSEYVLGLSVPRIELAPFEASAVAKIRLLMRMLAFPGGAAILRR